MVKISMPAALAASAIAAAYAQGPSAGAWYTLTAAQSREKSREVLLATFVIRTRKLVSDSCAGVQV